MKKSIAIFLLLIPPTLFSQQSREWENQIVNQLNREAMHAHFVPYASEEGALLQDSSQLRTYLLNGTWKFHYSKNPASRMFWRSSH